MLLPEYLWTAVGSFYNHHHRPVLLHLQGEDKGLSIYDVHTEGAKGSDSDGRMWTGRGGQAPCGRPHRKLKLESTDLILSSHAKKLASFSPEFRLSRNKKWTFFGNVN